MRAQVTLNNGVTLTREQFEQAQRGMSVWMPSPQALRRVAALADRVESDLRLGVGRFAHPEVGK